MSNDTHPSRRAVTQGLLAAALASQAAAASQEVHLFVGTYASPNGGLFPLTYRPAGDEWILGQPDKSIVNASFGTYSKRFDVHYLLDEQKVGQVGAYRCSNGTWTRLGGVPTNGSSPCYVSLDRAERCMVVANYDSGSIGFCRLDPKSGMPSAAEMHQDRGSGPNKDRQEGPHAHWARFSPDQTLLYTIDLGADRVFAYPFDPKNSRLGPVFAAYEAPPGSGPRHMVFHPRLPITYLASELAGTLTVLRRMPDGTLSRQQMLSALPAGFTAHNQTAHIAIDRRGRRVYVSNRGHNSIAIFDIAADGRATAAGHVPTGGDWPRYFLLMEDHRRLVVANERSGDLVVFELARDGGLVPSGRKLAVPRPAFLAQV
ncbi:MAG: lactonase family protein [Alphaproteobacteria bacterium]|nr:lactonase family protein [Alphaproteobacteria bacterium]